MYSNRKKIESFCKDNDLIVRDLAYVALGTCDRGWLLTIKDKYEGGVADFSSIAYHWNVSEGVNMLLKEIKDWIDFMEKEMGCCNV